jgi:hypothetical protein
MTLFHPPDSATCARHPLHRLPCPFCSLESGVAQSASNTPMKEQPANPLPSSAVLDTPQALREAIAERLTLIIGCTNTPPCRSCEYGRDNILRGVDALIAELRLRSASAGASPHKEKRPVASFRARKGECDDDHVALREMRKPR